MRGASEQRPAASPARKDQGDALDLPLLLAVLVLMALGLLMVLSSSGVMAEKIKGDALFFFKKQAVHSIAGLFLMWAILYLPGRFFYRTVYLWLLGSIVLLALTLTPLGITAGGASRWLDLGWISFQPLEVSKIGLVLYLGYFFSQKQDKLKTFSVGFFPPLLFTGVMAGLLLLQPDFGGAVFLILLFLLLSLVAGTSFTYLLGSVLLSASLATIMIVQAPYRLERWLAFLHPFENAQTSGYQLVQSLYALGSGNLFGQGLGAGKQKLFFLPEAHNDFILAVLGEELGFLGLSLVFTCLGTIVYKSFRISLRQQDLQDRLTGVGLALVIVLGAFLHAAVVLGSVPPKGLPFPFVSYGGSNLLTMFFCAGMILKIGMQRR